jgi:hypothetical protein
MVANSILGGVTLTLALPFLWNKYDLDIRARVTVYQNGKPTGEIRKRATGVLDYKLFGMMSLAPLEELSTQTEASVLSQIVAELLEEQTAETNGM